MWKPLALAAAIALAAPACNRVTYVNPHTTPSGVEVQHTGHFFLAGLVGHAQIWANRDCPNGVAGVQSRFSFLDVVLTTITLDIYTPRTYRISCGA